MKAQEGPLKREGAVSISRIKGSFPASISVPSAEHSAGCPLPQVLVRLSPALTQTGALEEAGVEAEKGSSC